MGVGLEPASVVGNGARMVDVTLHPDPAEVEPRRAALLVVVRALGGELDRAEIRAALDVLVDALEEVGVDRAGVDADLQEWRDTVAVRIALMREQSLAISQDLDDRVEARRIMADLAPDTYPDR